MSEVAMAFGFPWVPFGVVRFEVDKPPVAMAFGFPWVPLLVATNVLRPALSAKPEMSQT